jgi:hypothetical protein
MNSLLTISCNVRHQDRRHNHTAQASLKVMLPDTVPSATPWQKVPSGELNETQNEDNDQLHLFFANKQMQITTCCCTFKWTEMYLVHSIPRKHYAYETKQQPAFTRMETCPQQQYHYWMLYQGLQQQQWQFSIELWSSSHFSLYFSLFSDRAVI